MIKLAIDLGDSVTKIYRIGNGIVLAEPSCVAVNIETGKIKAIGQNAKDLWGRGTDFTAIRFPLDRGEIVDEKYAVVMLRYFLEKVEVKPSQAANVHALFCVPCGIRSEECSAYYRVAQGCGIGRISFAEVPYLASTGMNAPISDTSPVVDIDIGGSTTNISVVSYDGILAGICIGIGGKDIDDAIAEHILKERSIEIGPVTREELKNSVGSLIEGDGKSMVVRGKRTDYRNSAALNVFSPDILSPIQSVIDKILKYVDMLLEKIPAEVCSTVHRNGIFLSGGVSVLPGLRDEISSRFSMETHISEESPFAVVLGAGKIVEDPELLKKVKIRY